MSLLQPLFLFCKYKTKIFISPNGFAQYYGVPKGEKVHETDFLVEPYPMESSVKSIVGPQGWKVGLILGAAAVLTVGALYLIIKSSRAGEPAQITE